MDDRAVAVNDKFEAFRGTAAIWCRRLGLRFPRPRIGDLPAMAWLSAAGQVYLRLCGFSQLSAVLHGVNPFKASTAPTILFGDARTEGDLAAGVDHNPFWGSFVAGGTPSRRRDGLGWDTARGWSHRSRADTRSIRENGHDRKGSRCSLHCGISAGL